MPGKLLITGATGFIGGKLAEFYLEQGRPLRLLVRDPNRLGEKLKSGCEIIIADVTQPDTLPAAFHDVEVVIHAGGQLGRWGLAYSRMLEINVSGTESLVRFAAVNNVSRFIHLSAGGVTGPLGQDPADETFPPSPVTDYERSKWAGERRATEIAAELGLNLLVVRPTFTYGPGDPHKLDLFRAVKRGRFAFIGDGLSTVHPLYIDDLIQGIDLALKSEVKGAVFILSGPRPVTKRELIWGIADTLGVRRPSVKIPAALAMGAAWFCEQVASVFKFQPPLTQSRVLALSRNWGYSSEKALRLIGYKPQVDLTQGLQRTVSWYQDRGWI